MLRKLLLVDDDYDECHLFERILLDIDPAIACYYACNGKDAVEKLESKDIQIPEICFVDINMPFMNGWAFIDYLQQHPQYQSVSIIVYSTSSQAADIQKAKELGVSYFIKPNVLDELKHKLETLYSSPLPLHLDNQ